MPVPLLYDTGMLIALVPRKAKSVQIHRGLTRSLKRPMVAAPVLGRM